MIGIKSGFGVVIAVLLAGCGGSSGDGSGYCAASFEGGSVSPSCTTCSGYDATKSGAFAASIDNNSNTYQGFSFGASGGTITISAVAPSGRTFPAGATAGALALFPAGVPVTASYSLYKAGTPVAATSGGTIASGAAPSGAGSVTFYPVVPSAAIDRIDLAISVPTDPSSAGFQLNEVCGVR